MFPSSIMKKNFRNLLSYLSYNRIPLTPLSLTLYIWVPIFSRSSLSFTDCDRARPSANNSLYQTMKISFENKDIWRKVGKFRAKKIKMLGRNIEYWLSNWNLLKCSKTIYFCSYTIIWLIHTNTWLYWIKENETENNRKVE